MKDFPKHLLASLCGWLMLAALVATLGPGAPVAQAAATVPASLFTQYTLPGNPKNLYVEAPDRVWFTLPAADKVVLLNSGVVTEYATGAGSQPYDLVLDNGALWVTLLGGNAIGKLTVSNGNFVTFAIPTPDSEPTGITAGGGYIWFVERQGDNLGRLDPTSGVITEFTDKNPNDDNLVDMTGALLEDVAYSSIGPWLTGPAFRSSVAFFQLSTGKFSAAPAGEDAEPMAVVIDNVGDTWLAARGTNRLGRFGLNTLGIWQWYDLPAGASGPDSLFVREANGRRELWYARSSINRIGAQFAAFSGVAQGQVERELPVAGAAPWGVGVDANGQVWAAASGSGEGVTWEAPFFENFLSLPLIRRPALQ